jgi:CotH kinase protein/Chitobiase/beta-hexosaminidase C-terminal domain/Secretion system C-terminal sorting domain
MKKILLASFLLVMMQTVFAQVVINEGSNKNYTTIKDEEEESEDWIELFNSGSGVVDLFNYSLTDTTSKPTQWRFPHYNLPAGAFKIIYCSGKNYIASNPFVQTANIANFTPANGWNTHSLSTPYTWDGTSNVLINVCSYSSSGYTYNSVFNQSATSFNSTISAFKDDDDGACGRSKGTAVMQRPNLKINGLVIGTGTIQNGSNDYPAPYGNWYWSARTQMLVLASELTAAGITTGNFNTLAFSVANADTANYDYIDISMNATLETSLTNKFFASGGNNFHTNFKISGDGETISLYNPSNILQHSLPINCAGIDASNGLFPNASATVASFYPPTPGASNNNSVSLSGSALPPSFSVIAGIKTASFNLTINNPNAAGSSVYYTLDGSDPSTSSNLYNGTPINIAVTTIVKAKAFVTAKVPSSISNVSYLFAVNHTTPILSVITDNDNLFGPNGNFDNPFEDWLKAAYVECFDSTAAHTLLFSQHTGMIQDGGAGGSRWQPQKSFKLVLDDGVLGDGAVNYKMIPDRPNRTKYGRFYLRNGSNQYLTFPHKDACQVKMMAGETNTSYSAWRPISVYINGQYWGLYELREKLDEEFYKLKDTANSSSIDILSQSYFYNNILRSVAGDPVDTFLANYDAFNALNETSSLYWDSADHYFDMVSYNDYVIGQSWMGNVDWPQNNIKLYRSNKTNKRYRFTIIDQELSMNPGGWTNCSVNHIDYLKNQSTGNPFINIWLKGMKNDRFKNYFINRFADLMNTAYDTSRLLRINKYMYDQTFSEMPNEYARWGSGTIASQMATFTNNYNTFRSELICRTTEVRNHITNELNLPKQVTITLNTMPANGGKIEISTITPTTYPWKGVYFDGVPVQLKAIANNGFTFLDWNANAILTDTLNPIFLDTLSSNLTFTANFKAIPNYIQPVENFTNYFTLYPNPAEDLIILQRVNDVVDVAANYQIRNSTGQLLLSGKVEKFQKETKINIGKLSSGIYVTTIVDNNANRKMQIKFVKN